MTDVYRCMIVVAAQAAQAATVCAQLAGPSAQGMFTTPLSADGATPATHYISAGEIEESFAAFLADPAVMYALCVDNSVALTLQDCTDLLAGFDVSSENAYEAMARLGLQMLEEEL